VLAGDLDATVAALTADVRVVSDSDGRVNAARRDIVGARKCAWFLIKGAEQTGGALAPVEVNGEPALAMVSRGVLRIAQLAVVDGRVDRVFFHCNPLKLTRLELPDGLAPGA